MESKQQDLVSSVVQDIAQGLQEFVYNRQEGDTESAEDAIVCVPYTAVNNLLINILIKYGVITAVQKKSVDPNICANEDKKGE